MAGPDAARRHYLEQFRDAWTGKQYASHEAFIERWMAWAAAVVTIDAAGFPLALPAPPAPAKRCFMLSRPTVIARAASGLIRKFTFSPASMKATRAYAEACAINVVGTCPCRLGSGRRGRLPATALFCLSQPSAIDGNVWSQANDFLALLAAGTDRPRVLLDVTYVGAIAEPPAAPIAADALPCWPSYSACQNRSAFITTASAVFCARDPMPSLFGNQWFKNLTSLQLGAALLERHDVFDLPRRYKAVQRDAAARIGGRLGLTLSPSDV